MRAALLCLLPLALTAQDIAGRLIEDATSAPVASAALKLRKQGQRELVAELESTREGRFTAAGIPPGDYTLEVSKPNYLTATLPIRLPDTSLSLRLVKFGVITGHVRDTAGAPLPARTLEQGGRTKGGTRVAVLAKLPATDSLSLVRDMPVDSTGVFRFFNLPPGQYAVGVFYSNLPIGSGASLYPNTAQPKIFTVSGGEDYRSVDFTIPAQASFSISGAVAAPSVAAVRPAPEFVVALGLPEAPWIAISQVWTQNGKFQFEKVPSGVYDLYASGPTRGYGAYEAMLGPKPVFGRTRVTVSGQNIPGLEVSLSPGLAISLEARGADSEKLPAGCPRDIPVTLTSLEPWAAMLTKSSTAQFGAGVKVEDLAPGRYRISARVTGDCFSAAETEFDARTLTAPVSVPVAAGGQLRGLLKGAAKPGAFHVTLLSNSTAAATPVRFAYTDAQGRFTFDALPPGPYRLAIQPTSSDPAGQSAHWSPGLANMIDVTIAGGSPTDFELPVSAIAKQ